MPRASRADRHNARARDSRGVLVATSAPAAAVITRSVGREPELGAPILVLKRKFWDLIADGVKSLEIRPLPFAARTRYIGRSGMLWGAVTFGDCQRIDSVDTWRALLGSHHWDVPVLPYKTTYALPVKSVEIFTTPVYYMRKRGQVGTAKYLPPHEIINESTATPQSEELPCA